MVTKLRSSKIAIEVPKEGAEAWIHVTVQQVLKDDDGNTVNIIPRYDYISKPISEIAVDAFPYEDPVLQQYGLISGVGVATAMTSVVIALMKEKYGGDVDENGDLIV